MKGLVGVLLLVAILLGGGIAFMFQQLTLVNQNLQRHVDESRDWSVQVSEQFAKQSAWNLDSQAKLEANMTSRLTDMTKSIQEAVALASANKETIEAEQAKAKEALEEEKKEAEEDEEEAFSPQEDETPEESEEREQSQQEFEDIKNLDPTEVATNPEAALAQAREIEERYRRHQLEARNLAHEIKNLEREIAELEAIEPKTEDLQRRIDEKKKLLKEKEKEKRKVERKMRQERMKLKILQALLRLAAMIAFANGNPALGMALLSASQSMGEMAEEGNGEQEPGGGYPPPPPPPPPMGGGPGQGPGQGQGQGQGPGQGTGPSPSQGNTPSGGSTPVGPPVTNPSDEETPEEATLAPTTGGGVIYVRYWLQSGRIQLSEDKAGPWRDWFTIDASILQKMNKGKLHQITESSKRLIYIDESGKPWEYEHGRSPQALKEWVEALP